MADARAELQKVSPGKLRKFFYGHNSRQEKKILERLALIKEAKALTTDFGHPQTHGPESEITGPTAQKSFALHR